MIWTAKDASLATGGEIFSTWQAGKIVFDSRLVEPGDLFLALPGSNSDGHDHVSQALAKGAAAAIVERIPENVDRSKLLLVKNSLMALNDLAKFKRAKSKAKFIAITGSVGKTSTKELLNLALNAHGKSFASRGNYNNYLGVPINLASMPDDLDYAVIEIGMDHAGEITPLSQMVKPNIAIITGIENIHRANFASIEEIALAKAEIFYGLEPNSLVILDSLSNCHDLLEKKALDNPHITKIINIGDNINKLDYLENNTRAGLKIAENEVKLNIDGIMGKHQIHNMVKALLVIDELKQDIYKSAKALEIFKLPRGRGEVSQIKVADKAITLIDDSYNAGPVSVKAALKNMSYYTGRKIAILGDMVDMGPESLNIHLSLKEELIANKIDKVIAFGEQMAQLHKTLPLAMQYGCYLNLKDLAKDLPNKLENGDILLIKGSFYLTRLYYFTQNLREGTLDAL